MLATRGDRLPAPAHRQAARRLDRLAGRLALLFAIAWTAPAAAVDGVIEINQARAIEGGITSGDTPGFPITISSSGSYRLTSNLGRTLLIGGSITSPVIDVTASNVTIDLNGFAITCRTLLGGSCPDQGDGGGSGGVGDGIKGVENLSVMNGTVSGHSDDGIDAGTDSRVENVRVVGNRDSGVELDSQGEILDSVAADNGGTGFRISFAGLISRCISQRNSVGMVAGLGTSILESTIYANDNAGILGLGTFAYGLTTLQSNSPNVQGSARQIAGNSCNGGTCP